ncbi:MAG: glycosyltransferase [Scytonematopsis contorta HA4267-MV1]|jgi:glycosyltransferase involved in cell wall biosynthesis|nr:glycosyltransferase [Scytonematopsis contorta HA4267-MV1]
MQIYTENLETNHNVNQDSLSQRRIMLFELNIRGHYAVYVQHLVRYWQEQELAGHLDIVVSPKFLEEHSNIVDIALESKQKNISFVAITPEEAKGLIPRKSPIHRALRALQEWHLMCKYATLLKTTECLLMYCDTSQTPLSLGMRATCPVSGIYFRPTFHYSELGQNKFTFKEQVQQWRERIIVPRVLANKSIKTLFSLDPFAVKQMEKFHGKAKIIPLSDPIKIYNNDESEVEQLKQTLGIESGRRVFLLFGVINGRKGIYQVLESIKLLPPELWEKLCLVLVGSIHLQEKENIQSRINEISNSVPVQVIVYDKYIANKEIQSYFLLSDVILAPYQRHVGASSILIRAAAAYKPVLSSDYGLMGEWTRHNHLGLAVDSTSPSEIAKGMTRFLLEDPSQFANHALMQSFVEENSVDNFANTIFSHI